MGTARDMMDCLIARIGAEQTVGEAARRMRALTVDVLAVYQPDGRLYGMITDRDIVVRCVAGGGDPRTTTVGELAQQPPVWVDVDAEESAVRDLAVQYPWSVLPVLEGYRLAGAVSRSRLLALAGRSPAW
ncbi:MAG TPA: CBS domain-containing protein [Pilimelia sp.]|nr:CBS domain-containing protein [Pilimelia sp.]